jgi:2-phosphoglycerate kinase
VTLICGASGVGKSSVAAPLALRYATPLAEADDIVTALVSMTTSRQQPMLHYWNTHPEVTSWQPDRVSQLHFEVAEALRPAFDAVIADHLEFGAPVVFEGDYLVPELANRFDDAVRAVVLDETDEARIAANYRRREPGNGDQSHRARVSALVGAELARRASAATVPVVAARPWADAIERVDRALRSHPGAAESVFPGSRLDGLP